MTAVFLTWLKSSRKAAERIRKQYNSNLPKGIV